eukprot:TRINITY_DN4285_c0_g1_i1.p1 TRINITY_DN4285_c0_g1~~TRINITY_DN4285_c0_g1_i1.p1  ORF type:complete len:361 (+),score=57.08 TRINITY_DN4285_c0_g1_i1:405-1487(+)
MRCRLCSCAKYIPDDELVFDAWKLRLTEKDWDAAYFDDSEVCLQCGHAPCDHGGADADAEGEEATVVSIVHIAEQGDGDAAKEIKKCVEFRKVAPQVAAAIDRERRSCVAEGALAVEGVAPVGRGELVPAPGLWVLYRTETSFSDVGLQIWRSSVLVAEYLACWGIREYGRGGVFWEVGAGVGLPGLLCAGLGVKTWLTDNRPCVVENLRAMTAMNAAVVEERASAKLFDFETRAIAPALAARHAGWDVDDLGAQVDLIIAADVIFAPHVTDLFLKFLAAHFATPHGARACVLGYDRRSGQYITDGEHPVDDMLGKLAAHGLAAQHIPPENIPELCTSYKRSPDMRLMIVTPREGRRREG